jgi:hypothetical protein
MDLPRNPDRRIVLASLAAAPLMLRCTTAQAQDALPRIVVNRDPSCGCCGGWVEHVRKAGFAAEVVESTDMNRVKTRLGVPQALAACHTAEVDGYVIEGHVPAAAIRRLLVEKPAAKGLAVPGMPVGSPGMEQGDRRQAYATILFMRDGRRQLFARH